MLELTNKQVTRVLSIRYYPLSLNINGLNYFIKPDEYYHEIIGEELGLLLGLTRAHYEPLNICGKNYVASLDLNTSGIFTTFEELITNEQEKISYNIPCIWNYLKLNYPEAQNLLSEILKMYFYDLLFMNSDRSFGNFGIIMNPNPHLAIFDNAYIFDSEIPPEISSIKDSLELKNSYEDLNNLLFILPLEYCEIIYDIFDSLPITITETLEAIEVKRGITIKNKIIYNYLYRTNYENIKEIIMKYRGEKHAR